MLVKIKQNIIIIIIIIIIIMISTKTRVKHTYWTMLS